MRHAAALRGRFDAKVFASGDTKKNLSFVIMISNRLNYVLSVNTIGETKED